MKKVILVDGNNLLFRSYYATIYAGKTMTNSKGLETNALYGFVNMVNKIISEEQPKYMVVAFDKGKTFRHDKYQTYKAGRIETPESLIKQFPIAKQILVAMGIKYLEIDNYEADDIIGTIAKMIDNNDGFVGTIVSSDKDLLQLISSDIEVKLLKQKGYIRYNYDIFVKEYGIEPVGIIDLKGLEGDSSDNIPGVKGIGHVTGLKLLREFTTLENLYDNIDSKIITDSVRNKLLSDKENAFMSKDIATIYKDIDLSIKLEDLKYECSNNDNLISLYKELEFFSLIPKVGNKTVSEVKKLDYQVIQNINELVIENDVALDLVTDGNYYNATIYGATIYNKDIAYYIPFDIMKECMTLLSSKVKYVFNYKKILVNLIENNIMLDDVSFDLMIATHLLEYHHHDNIDYLMKLFDIELSESNDEETVKLNSILKSKFIYNNYQLYLDELKKEDMLELFTTIEMPLCKVLAKMEVEGILVDRKVIEKLESSLRDKISVIEQDIYSIVGYEFNINSTQQLAKVLFTDLQLPAIRKISTGYSTDIKVLLKLRDKHPIIDKLIEYRELSKLQTTYITPLLEYICKDGKIHTIFNQTLTRTGRLSSMNPNLQNIPVKKEYGRLIRKAFIAEENCLIMSCDYSQIELRVFTHLANNKKFIEAFNEGIDIHTKTAMDLFGVMKEDVTKMQRRQAKAVNFGILYGISSYGLSEELNIFSNQAKNFLEKYQETYPGIKKYMNEVIKEAYQNGYVRTLMKRKRTIEELRQTNKLIKKTGERMAMNTPVQGSSAEILKKAMIEIDKYITDNHLSSRMLLQVHDELIFNCPLKEKEILNNAVTNIMENTYKLNVPLVVDVNFGNNWYEAK
ncbi:MAG: DNA polymerase I [bacterium]|nr:DNA polymerase I [bacterium]